MLASTFISYGIIKGLKTQNFYRGVDRVAEKIQLAQDLSLIHEADSSITLKNTDKGILTYIKTELSFKQKDEIEDVFLISGNTCLEFLSQGGQMPEETLAFSSKRQDSKGILFIHLQGTPCLKIMKKQYE